jgi:hypothetical protein
MARTGSMHRVLVDHSLHVLSATSVGTKVADYKLALQHVYGNMVLDEAPVVSVIPECHGYNAGAVDCTLYTCSTPHVCPVMNV